jgi:hypothetical protein
VGDIASLPPPSPARDPACAGLDPSLLDRDDRRHGKGDRRGRRGRDERERERLQLDQDEAHYAYRYQNLEEVVGQVMSVAKDQNGCR